MPKQRGRGGETPCVVTVDGTEMGDTIEVEAVKVEW
jgi:hypothetical protein